MISAGSFHSGGANAGVCDGAVRFVSETVNTGQTPSGADLSTILGVTSQPWLNYTGPSIWGVWGAFGTASHGEAASLP
jgi:hypothetical protein